MLRERKIRQKSIHGNKKFWKDLFNGQDVVRLSELRINQFPVVLKNDKILKRFEELSQSICLSWELRQTKGENYMKKFSELGLNLNFIKYAISTLTFLCVFWEVMRQVGQYFWCRLNKIAWHWDGCRLPFDL